MTTIDMPVFKFAEGDKVRKVGGSYQATGYIVGIAVTTTGDVRYVFEFETFPGMLHIFNEGQLEHAKENI
ncbi:MAG: hypothetical protein EB127_06860 [Alphaproteobacteria bacterium]|nr:hypothetical protein [Alphaproteobacteria bacterium]